MEWKETLSEDGKCWWLATDRAPCVAQIRKARGSYAIEFYDGIGDGFTRSMGYRDLAKAKHVAARRFREAVLRSTSFCVTPPQDAMLEPEFLYIP
jgi:hypothetical protein